MENQSEENVLLAKSEIGVIERCQCKGYHLLLRNIKLHFNRQEFLALRDLFTQANEKEGEDFLFSYVNRERF